MASNSAAKRFKRIVVIGGTGHFGGRISRRLLGAKNTELIVSSRSARGAELLAEELRSLQGDAIVRAAGLDQRSPEFCRDLKALSPDVVIHTAGPYQGQDYAVAEACLESGSHYIDLADGRDFVAKFGRLDAEAQRHNLLLVSGASTLPGLSSVVIDSLRQKFEQICEIEISIAPAHQTPRGASTIAAVLSYCGKPFRVLVNGNWVTRYGWQDLRLQRYPDLGRRLSAACDVPDLGLLPEYVDGVDTVTFHAALEAKWEQLALWAMGWAARAGLIKSWSGFIPMFQRLSNRLIGLGSVDGGMQIRISGVRIDGAAGAVTWNLTARQNHGPEIPCTPAIILAQKLLADELDVRGAVPCLGMFSLSEFATELAGFAVSWEIEESA